jgi:hypothetical protein
MNLIQGAGRPKAGVTLLTWYCVSVKSFDEQRKRNHRPYSLGLAALLLHGPVAFLLVRKGHPNRAFSS